MNDSASSTPSSARSLWGQTALLGVTLLLGGGLMLSGIWEYRLARKNAASITIAQITAMLSGMKREMKRMPSAISKTNDNALEEIFQHISENGVTAIAILNREGHPLRTVGVPSVDFDSSFPRLRAQQRTPIRIVFVNNNLLTHAMVEWPTPSTRLSKHRRDRSLGPHHRRSLVLMLEIIPQEAIHLVNHAFWIMVINCLVACVLMGAALVFRHMDRRNRALERQLATDAQLKFLGEMSAVLGHELKNTIAALKGNAQLLQEHAFDDPQEGARLIVDDATYLQEITEQILEFAKTGSLKPERVYLDDLAAAAVEFSAAHPVEIAIEGPPPVWMLDRQKMQQVLVNLLINARAEKSESPIHLKIEGGDHLTIVVQDHGPGIPPDKLERIFDPFFTGKAKGTGLGLAYARRVINAHGGIISCRNTDQGAQFIITIPSGASQGDSPDVTEHQL